MEAGTWLALGTLGVALVGLILVVRQLRLQRREMQAAFGNMYVQRFWQIDDDLHLTPKRRRRHRQHRRRYLRLFEDEFDIARLGFLDSSQWRLWHAVLDDPGALHRVKDDLRVCDPDWKEFSRLRACICQRAIEGGSHDVDECMGTVRRRRGWARRSPVARD